MTNFKATLRAGARKARAAGRAAYTHAKAGARRVRAAAAPALSRARALHENYELSQAPKLTLREQMFFAKRLAFLVSASVPILESLQMLSEQSRSRRSARVMQSVIADVTNGYSLSRALARFEDIFGDFGVNIIRIGESSGTLSQNLDYLAEELKKSDELRRKVLGAMVYPAVITAATLAITGFLTLYLFPKIMPIFTSLHMNLPLSTKIVIAVSSFLQVWGLWLLLGVLALAAASIYALKKYPSVRYRADAMLLALPVIGDVIRAFNLATATRTLGLLLRSGVTLAAALPLTADTTKNLIYKEQYRELAEAVLRGERMSGQLAKRTDLFPPVATQMIAVGERTGSLSTTLVYLSELYEAEVDDFTKNLSSLIEPALMVMMGVLVGFIAIAIITPIYGITQNLHP